MVEDKIDEKKETILPENKEGETTIPLTATATPNNKKAKEGSFLPLIIVMLASMIIAFYWDKLPWISNAIHSIFDPSAGALLNWNLNLGMILIVFIITALTTLVQKYATDQKTLKELRKEQKEIQKQMKEFKNHPEKLLELQKKQMAMMPKQMKLSMRAIAYTGIPFILFFRWFNDYFIANPDSKFLFGMGWFLFYFIFAIIFGSLLRKWLDVV
jgi:uncharacterized membrane protein (DUF106 family)